MATSLVQATRLMWCAGLAQITGQPQSGGIHEWIARGTYAPQATSRDVVLTGVDPKYLLGSIGADINRLSTAASETLKNISEIKDVPKSVAWPYVKLYYASLFYVHVLLRMWGRSPSYFRTEELLRLRGTLTAYGVNSPFKLNTGQYLLSVGTAAQSVSLTSDSGGDGAHEAAWKQSTKALDDWEVRVSASTYVADDRKKLGQDIASLRSLVTNGGQHSSWPSQMRNNIQYRQAAGVWYPYIGKAKTLTLQQDVQSLFSGDADLAKLLASSGTDLARLRAACCAIICVARGAIDDMCNVSGSKSFLRYGQRKFEDAANAA